MAASIKPSIAIISLGSMGVGIARLLVAHRYPVLTSLQDRSPSTAARVLSFANSVISRGHSFRVVSTDAELVAAADVVLSIVPPEHAHGMAVRIADAVKASTSSQQRQNGPLYLLDLNAVSPRQARETAAAVKSAAGDSVIFIDGGIIGGPPQASDPENPKADVASWTRPSIPLSGPHTLASLSFPSLLSPKSSSGEDAGKTLANVLNVRHVGSEIGKASGLKMCFASMTKGLTAIGIQAFTTAQRLGVREELEEHMAAFAPVLKKTVMGGLVGMPPKAYRWIAEMELICETFRDDGGFDSTLFDEVAKVYDVVANQSELGKEKTEERKRGLDVEDVAVLMAEGLGRGKKARKA